MEISPVSGSVDATRLQQATATRETQNADNVRQQQQAQTSEQSRVQAIPQSTTNLEGQSIGRVINTTA